LERVETRGESRSDVKRTALASALPASGEQAQNLDLNCSSFPVQHRPEVLSMDWTNQGNAMANLTINGKTIDVDVEADTPLLWVIRENIGLTGTKYGCGIAQCGACTVHIDGAATRSCGMQVGDAVGKQITTIEGLAVNGALHKVQQAWIDNDVPQCGYCQSGMIMAVAALLKDNPKPTDADIDDAITNICRCGTFQQVREAIHAAANV
jgi:isoquinoline 1-oxidoreductase subunit alpha